MTEPVPNAPENAPAPAPVATQQQPEPVEDVNSLPEWARAAITKANREAANYRTQVNELKPQADQFRALEEASKTELQRLQEAQAAAQRDAEQARADAVRYKAAATYGISGDHFDLLGSGSEEEVTARAAKIAALLAQSAPPASPPAAPPPGRPVEQLRPGATPAGAVDEEEMVFQSLFGPGR